MKRDKKTIESCICKDCDEKFQDKTTFLKHNWFWHKKKYSATLTEYFYNGKTPLCKCGCGTEMIYRSKIGDFNEYVRGHISRIKNNFQTEKSINNSKKTIKKLNAEGKWGKNISPEKLEMLRDKMIGEKNHMYGKTHTDEIKGLLSEQKKELYLNNEEYRLAHNQRSKEYWSKEESKQKQRKQRYGYEGFSSKELEQYELIAAKIKENNIKGIVYLINVENTNKYKIGFTSKHPFKRKSNLQTAMPFKLNLVNWFSTNYNYKLEKILHKYFKDCNIAHEWFELSAEQATSFTYICQQFEKDLSELKTFINDSN